MPNVSAVDKPGVLATLSANAATNGRVNAKFDRALKKIKKEPKVKTVKLERKQGRPKAGRAVFTQAQIDALPEYGSVSEVSRALAIKHTSLQQWCDRGKNRLTFVHQGKHKLFRKDVLIAWLTATRRFNVKEEKAK